MKLTLKLILVVCILSSIAFADDDGNMGNGGRNCQPPSVCRAVEQPVGKDITEDDSLVGFIRTYLLSLFE